MTKIDSQKVNKIIELLKIAVSVDDLEVVKITLSSVIELLEEIK